MGNFWPAEYWFFVVVTFSCQVTGRPGDGMSVWERKQDNPTSERQLFTYGTFPNGFLWGVGSSSLQLEDDHYNRGPSIWDDSLRHHQSWLTEVTNGTFTSLAHKSLPALEFLGVKFFYFSLSWPRLFPEGTGVPNQQGVQYYNILINGLISKNVIPVIALYHWDLPVPIQDKYGGWANHTVIHLFNDYAKFCFQKFGDRVKYWITMHNPYLISRHDHSSNGIHAPWDSPWISAVAHNLIKAHATVWHTYNRHFRQLQKGYISVTLGTPWIKPASKITYCQECREFLEAILGRFAKPIHTDGDYPESLKKEYGSILPNFTAAEQKFINGTADFFALSFGPNDFKIPKKNSFFNHSLNLRDILNWIKMEYDNPRILIMENGWFSNSSIRTEDTIIIHMMKMFINQVLQAIKHDGVDVFGYTAWALADGFEWHNGYKLRRGLFYVDFNKKDKEMRPKTSALYYKQIIGENGFPLMDSASSVHGQFPCDFSWGVTDSILKVEQNPSSPQFTDRHLYIWNITGDHNLHVVEGVKLKTKPAQCTDFTSIRDKMTLLKRMKVTHFKFALNWSLILPRGDLSIIKREVLRYYRCIVEEASNHGIKTMVILYYPTNASLHLPLPLLHNGGWINKTTTEAFSLYAELCFQELGDLVKQWITINEPNRLGQLYRTNNLSYQAMHNGLLAHAMAWHTYDKKYRSVQNGYISTSLHANWAEPANPFITSHAEAADRFLQFDIAWLAEPIFGSGDYPVHMKQYINYKKQRRLSNTSLPHFTKEEKALVKGSADFFAVNHFTTNLVFHQAKHDGTFDSDQDLNLFKDVNRLHSEKNQAVVPSGIRKLLNWVKRKYGDIPIYITANGIDDQSSKNDQIRIYYLQQYNRHILQAYLEDNINLKGYYAFKLTDTDYGFYSPKMGARQSVDAYSTLISQNGFLLDPSDNKCRTINQESQCSLCVFLEQKKPLIFFTFCLFSTLALLLAVTIIRKYKRRRRKLHKDKQSVRFLFKRKDSFSCC